MDITNHSWSGQVRLCGGRGAVSGVDDRLITPTLCRVAARSPGDHDDVPFEVWRIDVRHAVLAAVTGFVTDTCADDLRGTGVDVAADVLADFISDGKCLRSTFMYLGWLCGAGPDDAALRAAASFELLHIFALLQD